MNLYLYTLAAGTLKRTATRIRVIGGSAAGAALFTLLLPAPGIPVFIKRFVGPMIVSMAVTAMIFKLKQFKVIFKVTGYLFIYAFALGGIMNFLFSAIPFLYNRQKNMWYILGAGMAGYYIVSWWLAQFKNKSKKNICKVRLCGYEDEIEVNALIDTGNSLREPISGKPVSVLEEEMISRLSGIKIPEKLKAIPYHSVDRSNGIMEGYEIPEMIIKDEGEDLRWQKVIVGISKNKISASGRYQMILHPDLCNEASGLKRAAFDNQKTRRESK